MKTYKSIAKRFKITKKGKLIHRATGQNHFRSKKTGRYVINKRRKKEASRCFKKTILKAIRRN